MAIKSLSDLNTALDAGKFHFQRFQKNAGTGHAKVWADPTFASGQPPYDARVGVVNTFTPCVAQRNDSIYFPAINAGEERYLLSATMWPSQATFNGPQSVVIFDLLGYYPLIDGDSTDLQEMNNSATLPRYTDGKGVVAVMINHVAPALQAGLMSITYTASDNVQRTRTVDVPANGQNLVCSGSMNTTGAAMSAYAMPLDGGQGIKSIDSIQYTTPPSGLHVIYLIKPLASMVLGDNLVAAEKDFLIRDGFRLPRIYDGAWLGWMDMLAAGTTNRAVTWFGGFTFAWG